MISVLIPLSASGTDEEPITAPNNGQNIGETDSKGVGRGDSRPGPIDRVAYAQAVHSAESMAYDPVAQALASLYGMDLLNVTWEDTGRYKNSAVGPNISDMTIQVELKDPKTGLRDLHLMPVLRYPNFADLTADLRPEDFRLLVGNETGDSLVDIDLKTFLQRPGDYLTDPESWRGGPESLLARQRDSHVLVSAQACFLPIPSGGEAVFNPVLFNYQSSEGNPAVLTILATREGTSVTIIDNQRDGFESGGFWGQRLFFNQSGERASLTGKRLSDWEVENQADDSGESTSPDNPVVEAADETGLNMVLLIQVPLKHESFYRDMMVGESADMMNEKAIESAAGVEEAVIGHGPVEGPFTEIDGLDIERDPDFPIRVTVQFYMATEDGLVTDQDIRKLARQIERIYEDADYVGSLVVQGPTGRPTEYNGSKIEPPNWWEAFWLKHFEATGMTREETLRQLADSTGSFTIPRREQELIRLLREAGIAVEA